MNDLTRYRWTNQSNGAWVDTESMRQELVADGVLVPDDSLQRIADVWEATVGSGYIKDNIRHLAPELAALLDGLNDG